MVWDLVRDSAFGHCVRLASRGKHFQYAEEKDSSTWTKFVNQDKSADEAPHGTTEPPGNSDKVPRRSIESRTRGGVFSDENNSPSSSQPQVADEANMHNEESGAIVDPKKGKDRLVIDWFGPGDADVWIKHSIRLLRILIAEFRTLETGAPERRSSSRSRSAS